MRNIFCTKTVGDQFPEFKLFGVLKDKINTYSSDILTDKWTIIFFYPEDFSFICPTEAKAFEKHKKKSMQRGGQVFGISVDEVDTHKAWVKE